MPSLEGATEWLNSSLVLDNLCGHATLVQFRAISCPICKTNVPGLQQLTQVYAAHGLHLVSVHMPRREADMDVAKVKAFIAEVGLSSPCAIDNDHAIGDRFQTGNVWPAYLLFDANGKLRSRAAGTLGLKMAENSLRRMLGVEEQEGIAA